MLTNSCGVGRLSIYSVLDKQSWTLFRKSGRLVKISWTYAQTPLCTLHISCDVSAWGGRQKGQQRRFVNDNSVYSVLEPKHEELLRFSVGHKPHPSWKHIGIESTLPPLLWNQTSAGLSRPWRITHLLEPNSATQKHDGPSVTAERALPSECEVFFLHHLTRLRFHAEKLEACEAGATRPLMCALCKC